MLTPAMFERGALPGTEGPLLRSRAELRISLVGACVPRPVTLSGWDFATARPKRTRRAVAAGAVYWLDLEGPPGARAAWLEEAWMKNVSDGEQDRRDGFGLCAVGVA